MEEIVFKNLHILWLLTLIPVFIGLFAFSRIIRKKQIKKLGKSEVSKRLILESSAFRPSLKFGISMLAITLLIIGLARPQFVTETKVNASENNEIIIALDISNSMLAKSQNSSVTRMDLAKNTIINLLDNLNHEKVGMVLFAGQAYMQIPVTQDYSAYKLMLQSIDPTFISAQGTDISDAIKLAVNAFTPEKNNQKTIIIISDGEDHQGNIEKMTSLAKSSGVKIYTVGIGSSRGEPIYLNGEVLKDQTGEIVISKLNEKVLREIAKETDGEYINFTTNPRALKDIYSSMNKTDNEGKTKVAKYDDKYHYFVFPALLLLLLDFFILNRKNRWIAKIKIFEKSIR